MTSISQMQAMCPKCSTDLTRIIVVESDIGIGDSEDVVYLDCPGCETSLVVELVARLDVRVG